MTDILLCVLIALVAIGVHQLANIRRSLTDLFVMALFRPSVDFQGGQKGTSFKTSLSIAGA